MAASCRRLLLSVLAGLKAKLLRPDVVREALREYYPERAQLRVEEQSRERTIAKKLPIELVAHGRLAEITALAHRKQTGTALTARLVAGEGPPSRNPGVSNSWNYRMYHNDVPLRSSSVGSLVGHEHGRAVPSGGPGW